MQAFKDIVQQCEKNSIECEISTLDFTNFKILFKFLTYIHILILLPKLFRAMNNFYNTYDNAPFVKDDSFITDYF